MSEIKTATVSELGYYANVIEVGNFIAKDKDGSVWEFSLQPFRLTDAWESTGCCFGCLGCDFELSELIQETPWEDCLFQVVES